MNNALVDQLKATGVISSPSVEAAFRAVPRHIFVPDVPLDQVYCDEVIVTKQSAAGQPTSSCEQPAIIAVMLEQLGAQPGENILEIGTGTGHVAALLAHLVGPAGRVTTIDIQSDLVELAREHLGVAGFPGVNVVCADGGYGYVESAPYDRILLTVGSSDIPPAWYEQLRAGGRLVLPLYLLLGVQRSVAFEKTPTGFSSLSLKPCGFMPLQGAFAAEGPHEVELGSEPGLTFGQVRVRSVDTQAIYRLLSGLSRDMATEVTVTPWELLNGLLAWLVLKEPQFCGLRAQGNWLNQGQVPYLVGVANQFVAADGLSDGAQRLALLARDQERPLPADLRMIFQGPPFSLHVVSYGPDDALGERLVQQVRDWNQSGRPTIDQARIYAYPRSVPYTPSAGEYVLDRPSVRLVLHWPAGNRP